MSSWNCARNSGITCSNANRFAYITLNSAADYYSTFRALQKVAYKEKMMRENLNNFLEKIEWRDFEINPDQGYYIRICTEKTETEATLPISNEALELYGEWGPEKYSKA